jgi:hypothetical protein
VCKEEGKGVMVGKEKNNRKDTTKAKLLACLLVCACVHIYENVIAKAMLFFYMKKKRQIR